MNALLAHALVLAQSMPPFLKKLLPSKVPWLGIGTAAAIAFVIMIVVKIRKRKKAAAAAAAPAAAPVVTPRALRGVWKRFLAQIPGEFRRYVLHFQSFVVLGEAGSGKSLLIARCTDWKGQAAQFYPSYVANPLYQLYLASRAIVHEVPSFVLADTSARARAALLDVWGRATGKRAPVVVLSISAAALREASPESLRAQAQTLRGKINILARLRNEPVETRVVLTHMDQVEGYLAFADFVEKQEIPHRIQLDPAAPGLGLATCLEPFEAYLPLALVKLPARDYLRILTFLERASSTFERLGLLLTALREDDPRSFEPDVRDLYLSSHTGGGPAAVSNPFETSLATHGQTIERAVARRHRLVAGAIAACGLLWLGAGFVWEHSRLTEARAALERFEAEGKAHLGAETELALERFAEGEGGLARILPSFSAGRTQRLRARLATEIRETHLRPIARNLAGSPRAHEAGLYLLGLTYADREGPLGRLILAGRVGEWSQALRLDEALVGAYVRASDKPWAGTLALDELPYERPVASVTQPEIWHALCIEVRDAIASGAITPERLARLREAATELRVGLAAVGRRHTTQQVHGLLASDPRFQQALFRRYAADLQLPPWLLEQRPQLEALLALVAEADMHVTPLAEQSLAELAARLQGIQALTQQEGRTIQFALDERVYTFDEGRWQRVIDSGKALTLVRRFVRDNERRGAGIFFAEAPVGPARPGDPEGPAGVVMRPPLATEFLFPGRGRVDAEYTRDAFLRRVAEPVARFEASLAALDLDPETRDALESLLNGAIEQYAAEYERQWRTFYESWALRADSLGNLKLALDHLRQPTSRFQEFVQAVVDNTSFDDVRSPRLRPVADRTAQLRPLARLVARADPRAPCVLDDYRALLARVLSDLDGLSPPVETPDDGRTVQDVDFEALLTPLGRLAFDIVHANRDSYLLLTERWLAEAGIEGRMREPFLLPIRAVEGLGRADIAASVARSWRERVLVEVTPILERFPFKPGQAEAATPVQIEAALHPTTGTFWIAFRRFIGPVCVDQPGPFRCWGPLRPLASGFQWPERLFPVVNHLSELTAALWDRDALPRPLVLTLRPEPMQRLIPGQPAPILTFIGSGRSSVFGFNQRPAWQTLEVEWFTRVPAQVGLQVGTPGTGARTSHSLTVPEGYWALHRLLRQGPTAPDGTTFTIETGQPGVADFTVRFSYREDPFRLFEVPWAPSEGQHADQ